jgi:hypothetical protein
MDRAVRAELTAMSGLGILKRAEYQSVKIPGLGGLPHQQINDCIDRVSAGIRGNHRLTVQEVAGEVGISIQSCHQFLLKKT